MQWVELICLQGLFSSYMQSFLIMPIQRIPRYRLLLQEIFKHTDASKADHSILLVIIQISFHPRKPLSPYQNLLAIVMNPLIGIRTRQSSLPFNRNFHKVNLFPLLARFFEKRWPPLWTHLHHRTVSRRSSYQTASSLQMTIHLYQHSLYTSFFPSFSVDSLLHPMILFFFILTPNRFRSCFVLRTVVILDNWVICFRQSLLISIHTVHTVISNSYPRTVVSVRNAAPSYVRIVVVLWQNWSGCWTKRERMIPWRHGSRQELMWISSCAPAASSMFDTTHVQI